jgi:hypothetical protein|tara:strand:+ start:8244 stop:8390 length:147 start_codon:yes stop_codon:yes gene_type:complete
MARKKKKKKKINDKVVVINVTRNKRKIRILDLEEKKRSVTDNKTDINE